MQVLPYCISIINKTKGNQSMLITTHTVKDVATMLGITNYGTWKKDHEACFALAQYLEDLSEREKKPVIIKISHLVQDFSIYKSLDDYNATFAPSVESLHDLKKLTTVILLKDGRFIAQDF
jgi:hypothetical protein